MIQFADYAAWQRETLRPGSVTYRNSILWWKRQLAGPILRRIFPFRDQLSYSVARPSEGVLWQKLSRRVSNNLDHLARQQGVTYFTVRLAAFLAVLADACKRLDIVIGTYLTNRVRVELQNMFGCFGNLVTLRLQYQSDLPFAIG